jgi:hypothetical protein
MHFVNYLGLYHRNSNMSITLESDTSLDLFDIDENDFEYEQDYQGPQLEDTFSRNLHAHNATSSIKNVISTLMVITRSPPVLNLDIARACLMRIPLRHSYTFLKHLCYHFPLLQPNQICLMNEPLLSRVPNHLTLSFIRRSTPLLLPIVPSARLCLASRPSSLAILQPCKHPSVLHA